MTALTFRTTALVAVGVLALASCSKSEDPGIAHLSATVTIPESPSAP